MGLAASTVRWVVGCPAFGRRPLRWGSRSVAVREKCVSPFPTGICGYGQEEKDGTCGTWRQPSNSGSGFMSYHLFNELTPGG